MKNLREYLEEQINEDLIQAVLSGSRSDSGPSKVKIRPVKLKNQICYQASATEGTKIFHKNYIWKKRSQIILDSFRPGEDGWMERFW